MLDPQATNLHPARIVERRAIGSRGRLVTLAVPPALAAAYTAPGQYCEIRVDGHTGYFAIASPPGSGGSGADCGAGWPGAGWPGVSPPDPSPPAEPRLAFYVQDNGGSSTALIQRPLGTAVAIARPAGEGYRLAAALADGGPLIALATGSGWFGLQCALWAIAGAGRTATVYAGFRAPPDALDTAGQQRLRDRGFTVHLCLSRPPPGWTGRRGHVQAALEADAPDLGAAFDRAAAWVLACGQPEMLAGARAVARGLGLPPARFLTNY